MRHPGSRSSRALLSETVKIFSPRPRQRYQQLRPRHMRIPFKLNQEDDEITNRSSCNKYFRHQKRHHTHTPDKQQQRNP